MKTLAARPARRALTAVAGLALSLSAIAWFGFVGPAWAATCPPSFNAECPTGCSPMGLAQNGTCCNTLPNPDTCCHYTAQFVPCYDISTQQPCKACSGQYGAGLCTNMHASQPAHCNSCTLVCINE
jgi:hypothetical protein